MNERVIYVSPRQLEDEGIGVPMGMEGVGPDEKVPVLVDAIEEQLRHSILGRATSPRLANQQEGFEVAVCVKVGDHFYPLEINEVRYKVRIPVLGTREQVMVFQRLIADKGVSLDELADADISNDVYKELTANSIDGNALYQDKVGRLERIYDEQRNDPDVSRLLDRINRGL